MVLKTLYVDTLFDTLIKFPYDNIPSQHKSSENKK